MCLQSAGVILSIRLDDEWVSTALSDHLHWACNDTTANTGNCFRWRDTAATCCCLFRHICRSSSNEQVDVTTCDLSLQPSVSLSSLFFLFFFFQPHWCMLISTSLSFCLPLSDCNWSADRSEDPDSDSDEAVQCSQAAVHSDNGWQLRGRQGYPGLTRQPQH